MIESKIGKTPRYMRFPFGSSNSESIKGVQNADLTSVYWSTDPEDYEDGKPSGEISAAVLSQVQGGHIILMHDLHQSSVEALPAIVKGIKGKGLKFVTMSKCLGDL
jgi:peptidoglycan/xylan/chitin deacetylase (PgdA/CDA1 family)